ncbi:hypothetical protein F511_14802 [Dorcoceras hygrometricum]|uniref:Uncharacterized protein n=1 Tax=Dorcoceras hygrometricum TaxID=472368 RepID=A0A2Z7C7M5_9LAMI|nr:hypothetical protein F511_14802 [Dorcoceras hygrometricum]
MRDLRATRCARPALNDRTAAHEAARTSRPPCAASAHGVVRAVARAMGRRARWRPADPKNFFVFVDLKIERLDTIWHNCIDQIRTLALIPLLGNHGGSGSHLPARQRKNKIWPGDDQYNRLFTVGGGRSVNQIGQNNFRRAAAAAESGGGGDVRGGEEGRRPFGLGLGFVSKVIKLSRSRTPKNPLLMLNTLSSVSVRESRIQYLCDPQWFRDTASRGPTTIAAPESQFRTCPSDHDSIGYPRMSASGESSTTMHRLLHASGSHPIPPPNDPKTNQYNQDLGLIHSTNGNHLESPNEGSSIDHQVTIYLNAQNITMFPTNETWYFASQILVSCSGGLILILTAQSTRNMFRIHGDY